MQRKRFSDTGFDNGRATSKPIELHLPAGSLGSMRADCHFGADTVEADRPRYSLRAKQ